MEGFQFVRLAGEYRGGTSMLLDFKKKPVDCSGGENDNKMIKYC